MARGEVWIGASDGNFYYQDESDEVRHLYRNGGASGVVTQGGEVAYQAANNRFYWHWNGNSYYANTIAGPVTSEPNGSLFIDGGGIWLAYNGVARQLDIRGPNPVDPPPDPIEPPDEGDKTTFYYYDYSSGTDTLYEYFFNGTSGTLVDSRVGPCPGKSVQLTEPFVFEGSTYWTGYACSSH